MTTHRAPVTEEQESEMDDAILRAAVEVLREQALMVAQYAHEGRQSDALELVGLAAALDETRVKFWGKPS